MNKDRGRPRQIFRTAPAITEFHLSFSESSMPPSKASRNRWEKAFGFVKSDGQSTFQSISHNSGYFRILNVINFDQSLSE